ncbi:MAG: SGNH/GDSL hydrolase family protein [Proteobacteria bacterium]|nr:SGNH/GDSL hydrolase family protein [Pseudomonadota bacterium]
MSLAAILFVAAGVIVVLAVVLRRRKTAAVVLVNVAAVVAAVGGVEVYLTQQPPANGDGTRMEGSITKGFTHSDDVLGYAPNASAQVTAKKFFENTQIYDVTYTIDANGLRVVPAHAAGVKDCIIFFGDSFTFGEGVNDEQAFASLVAARFKDRYAVYNFGYSGYGPHQMLAMLQSDRMARILDCAPRHFFYLGITDHAARAAGLSPWDQHGPRYRVEADGSVVRDGYFDGSNWLVAKLGLGDVEKTVTTSPLWQRLFGRSDHATSDNMALLLGIVTTANREIRQRYPQATFDVLIWDNVGPGDVANVKTFAEGLAKAGIPETRMTDLVPDYTAHWTDYVLSRHDQHANPRMNKIVANHFIDVVEKYDAKAGK